MFIYIYITYIYNISFHNFGFNSLCIIAAFMDAVKSKMERLHIMKSLTEAFTAEFLNWCLKKEKVSLQLSFTVERLRLY